MYDIGWCVDCNASAVVVLLRAMREEINRIDVTIHQPEVSRCYNRENQVKVKSVNFIVLER